MIEADRETRTARESSSDPARFRVAQEAQLTAMTRYVEALVEGNLPVPHRLQQEVRLLGSVLSGRRTPPGRGRPPTGS